MEAAPATGGARPGRSPSHRPPTCADLVGLAALDDDGEGVRLLTILLTANRPDLRMRTAPSPRHRARTIGHEERVKYRTNTDNWAGTENYPSRLVEIL